MNKLFLNKNWIESASDFGAYYIANAEFPEPDR